MIILDEHETGRLNGLLNIERTGDKFPYDDENKAKPSKKDY